jgi:hypothetical protein
MPPHRRRSWWTTADLRAATVRELARVGKAARPGRFDVVVRSTPSTVRLDFRPSATAAAFDTDRATHDRQGSSEEVSSTPRVAIATLEGGSGDGTFTIDRDAFPSFSWFARLGVHVQSDRVRVADPDPAYVAAALTALNEACRQLGVPEAEIAFVDTVIPPPTTGLRYGFKGAFTTDRPKVIWVFANWTSLAELRGVVRHEAAHLAFARTHTPEESAGHSGPSEDFAQAFETAGDATP